MTEQEVIEKLSKFKEKLLKIRDERDEYKKEVESLKSDIESKDRIMSDIKDEHEKSLLEIENIHSGLDKLQELYDLKNTSYLELKEKAGKAIKKLVEENIEVKEQEIVSLNERVQLLETSTQENVDLVNKISDLTSKLDKVNQENITLKDTVANQDVIISKIETDYVKKDFHQDEINRIIEEKTKSDEEKQTVLSNTWKTQIQISEELRNTVQQLEEVNALLSQEKGDNESLKKSLEEKITDFDKYKITTEQRIKELERDAQNIDNSNKLEISRLTEKVKNLTTVKGELESTNKELLDKIKILEDALAKKSKETTIEPNASTVQERSVISKGTIPYKFGSTTATVMQKAKSFIEELYRDSVQMNGVYILGNPNEAATKVGLSEKEYNVFMNRLAECLEFDGVPLLYQQGGEWKSNLSKVKLVDFISTVSSK